MSHKSVDSLEDVRADMELHSEIQNSHVYVAKNFSTSLYPFLLSHHHQPMRTEDSDRL